MSGTTGCSDLLATCLANLSDITSEYGNCTCQPDECADSVAVDYNMALHIVCVFVILICSMLGAVTPMLTEKLPYSWTPIVILYGKCMGTGVVIACGLIHMLQPSNESLSSPCLPAGFTVYSYAYLFCMASSLFLHLADFLLSRWMHSLAEKGGPQIGHAHGPGGEEIDSHDHHHDSVVPVGSIDTYFDPDFGEHAPPSTPQPIDQMTKAVPIVEDPMAKEQVQRMVEAYMIEFAVTVHSVFIGLPVGVSDQNSLNALFVALAFHQFFEGVALGCRIVDAKLTVWNEIMLTLIFSIAAPIGIGIGIGVRSSLNPNSVTFLLVQGTFDGVCAGFLVFIGYALLIIDFPRDMAKICTGKRKHWQEFGMFAAVWTGAGVMAGIGYYL